MSISNSKKQANGNGSIEKYLDGHRIFWTAPEGRRSKVLRGTSYIEAERILDGILTDIRRGEYRDERAGNILFSDFLVDYLKVREREVRPGVYRNWRTYHLRHLIPSFGEMRMRDITPRHIALWWAEKADHPTNRRNVYRHLCTIFSLAIEWEILDSSPCQIKNLGRDAQRPDWTVNDFDDVLLRVDQFYRPALAVMFAGHLRLGELIALNGSDYRADGMLTVSKQVTDMGHTTDTKTGQKKTIKLLRRPGRLDPGDREPRARAAPSDSRAKRRTARDARTIRWQHETSEGASNEQRSRHRSRQRRGGQGSERRGSRLMACALSRLPRLLQGAAQRRGHRHRVVVAARRRPRNPWARRAGRRGAARALAHYRTFARPLSASHGLFLDDLFTSSEARGRGVASALLTRLAEIARDEGATVVRWITAGDNATARSLYDRVSTQTPWVTYDLAPASN